MQTKKSVVNRLRKTAQMKRIDARVISALPAPIVQELYIANDWGGLYLSPYSAMSQELYWQMRRLLRGMGYETAETENARTYMKVKLKHPESSHEINIHVDRPRDAIRCELLTVAVQTEPVREWACPDDPDFEAKKALSARLERALNS